MFTMDIVFIVNSNHIKSHLYHVKLLLLNESHATKIRRVYYISKPLTIRCNSSSGKSSLSSIVGTVSNDSSLSSFAFLCACLLSFLALSSSAFSLFKALAKRAITTFRTPKIEITFSSIASGAATLSEEIAVAAAAAASLLESASSIVNSAAVVVSSSSALTTEMVAISLTSSPSATFSANVDFSAAAIDLESSSDVAAVIALLAAAVRRAIAFSTAAL
uniref:Uncharacterized protein n=1 Tax=Glossina brevipalpis TaxID=37001 RepID=A0A1A9X566_9MUSC